MSPESTYASLCWISSSATVTTSQPSISRRAPFGSKPWKVPGPANVARARQRTAVRLRYVVRSQDLEREVRERLEQSGEVGADPVRRGQLLPVRRNGRSPRAPSTRARHRGRVRRALRSSAWRRLRWAWRRSLRAEEYRALHDSAARAGKRRAGDPRALAFAAAAAVARSASLQCAGRSRPGQGWCWSTPGCISPGRWHSWSERWSRSTCVSSTCD